MWLIKERDGEKVVEFRIASALTFNGAGYNCFPALIANSEDEDKYSIEAKLKRAFDSGNPPYKDQEQFKSMKVSDASSHCFCLTKKQLKQMLKELK